MNFNNFNEAMSTFFDRLKINPIEFELYSKNRLISKQPFTYNDNDPEDYYIVVKLYDNIGTVVTGTANGPKFVEYETLGQIEFNNDKWVNV